MLLIRLAYVGHIIDISWLSELQDIEIRGNELGSATELPRPKRIPILNSGNLFR